MMTEFVQLRPNTYCYIIDDGDENGEAKGTNKCVMKQKLKFKNYKNYLETNQLENETSHLEENDIEVDVIRESHEEMTKSNS